MLHKWWFYMIFTVLCCTFMNHCNPDSSTKTHISSLTQNMSFSIPLLYRKFTYPLTQNIPSFTKVHISSHHAPQMVRNIWNLLRNISLDKKKTKQKTKQKNKESQPWWGLGCFFFFWSTKWPCRICMSSIKIHCKYQWI